MRSTFLAALAFAATAAPLPAHAGERPVRAVVELFTSQGCSSCPPADALLKSYADQKDVMALTMPVTVWDHIGWKDTLASPRNTDRQRTYAAAFAQDSVYTPEMVINGIDHAVGSSRSKIDAAIERDAKDYAARRVPVGVQRRDSQVLVDLGAAPEGAGVKSATVWLGRLQKSVPVAIKRGENAGRTVTYYNVVRELVPAGVWAGRPKQLALEASAIKPSENEATFVLVQEGQQGPIIGAAWLGD